MRIFFVIRKNQRKSLEPANRLECGSRKTPLAIFQYLDGLFDSLERRLSSDDFHAFE